MSDPETAIEAVSALPEGRHEPMGAHPRDGGVNFAVFSCNAERIDVCIFDANGQREFARHRLNGPADSVFHGFLADAGPGLVYGLRAFGPHRPEAGHLFNPAKLLLDPCAREIVGLFRWDASNHAYSVGHPDGLRSIDPRDNAAIALKARVVAPGKPAAASLNAPRHRDADVVLYEVHVKGFSKQLPGIPESLRGTYAALAHPLSIETFRSLGVTTLSLLPVQYCVDEEALVRRGLVNYWGYNTLGFFCPDPRLSSQAEPSAVVREFRAMVDALHQAGIEIVLDVVYNHTPEGNEWGPSLAFRGLDNASWYRLSPQDRSRCENTSGCGNTINAAHPKVTQFILDSLRYWMEEMGVDGFRFDLATILGRTGQGFDPDANFFAALRQDPVLARARLIAEPWDGGPGGYQVGRFPGRFLDWNDKFRDAVRGYWLRRGVDRGEFARRFTASDDLFRHDQRKPTASVNFIAVHDGFTLADTVAYAGKHNLANGEDNRDGRDGELSCNFGVEGPSEDEAVNAQRRRIRRAMIATLLLAQGTPMLCAGDEFGNTQAGNNNAYCQDNPIGWLDWSAAEPEFRDFVASVTALRRREPLLHHDQWFRSGSDPGDDASLAWLLPSGAPVGLQDWHDPANHALAAVITPSTQPGLSGCPPVRLLLLFNPEAMGVPFTLPEGNWQLVLDSTGALAADGSPMPTQLVVPREALLVFHNRSRDAGASQ